MKYREVRDLSEINVGQIIRMYRNDVSSLEKLYTVISIMDSDKESIKCNVITEDKLQFIMYILNAPLVNKPKSYVTIMYQDITYKDSYITSRVKVN